VSRDRYPIEKSAFVVLADAEWSSKLTDEKACTVKNLNHQLMKLCRQYKDGGYATQTARSRILDLSANQLHALGYRHMQATSLKPKHVEALVKHWREEGIKTGTLKNRLSAIRWWAQKVNRQSIMARDNTAYGIGSRTFVAKESKAQVLDEARLAKIVDSYVRMSVRLQAAFGLRREEAIKFQPAYAMQGDHVRLKSSWTKGGRARVIPITHEDQRRLLEDVKALTRGGALIPPRLNYVQQLHRYEKQTANAGLSRLHGLRHAYAQRRYVELTARVCPAAGGLPSKDQSPEQRALDATARATISGELGHAREAISAVYLGR
jgi:site-specific recombinase XerC